MDKRIIQKIVEASGLSKGELILIHFWGEDVNRQVADDFAVAVAASGATPFVLQQSRSKNCQLFEVAEDSCFDDNYFSIFSKFDAVLDILTYQPVILGYELPENQFGLYRKYMRQLFSVLMQAKRFIQIRIPMEENALESGLEPQEYISRMTKAYDIDYHELKVECQKKITQISGAKKIILRTENNCELCFDLTNREWLIDAGEGDLPCGEIYIAPQETQTQGTIYFDKLYVKDVGVCEGVTLKICDGKLCDSDNETMRSFILGLPEECRVICELGFGMNAQVTDLCGYTVLDEKMAGAFHIGIGANTMFGGQNSAPIHMDFVGKGVFEIIMI